MHGRSRPHRTAVARMLSRSSERCIRAGVAQVAVWPVDGEPVPVAQALAAEYAPRPGRRPVGPAVGHRVFRVTGDGAAGVGGRPSRR